MRSAINRATFHLTEDVSARRQAPHETAIEAQLNVLINRCDAEIKVNWNKHKADYRISVHHAVQRLPHASASVKDLAGKTCSMTTTLKNCTEQ